MNRRCLHHASSFAVSETRSDPNSLTKAVPEVQFDFVSGYTRQRLICESPVQVFHRSVVGDVGFSGSEWRLGIILHEELRPFSEEKALALSNNLQDVSVSGLKSLPEYLVGILPVFRVRRLRPAHSASLCVT